MIQPQDDDLHSTGITIMADEEEEESIQGQFNDDELRKLSCEPRVSEFQRTKLERDAKKNWDLFYKRNGDRFFKNRYWTKREFKELFDDSMATQVKPVDSKNGCSNTSRKCLLEIGCGCGNFIIPLLENADKSDAADTNDSNSNMNDLLIYCTDISEKAIDILKSNPIYKRYHPSKVSAFVADITGDDWVGVIDRQFDGNLMDIVSLVFVLSALDPDKMHQAVRNIALVTKPNGLVLFRDYAIYDKAMLRFSENSKISDGFYVRQDGTRAYFFRKKQLIKLFDECHFKCSSVDYIRSETFNHATQDKYSRLFLQAKFVRKSNL